MSARESRADAAEIARLAIANAGGTTRPVTTPSLILTSATTRGGMTVASSGVIYVSSSSFSRIPRISPTTGAKRSLPWSAAPGREKSSKLSDFLLKKGWPEGYDDEAIDGIGDALLKTGS